MRSLFLLFCGILAPFCVYSSEHVFVTANAQLIGYSLDEDSGALTQVYSKSFPAAGAMAVNPDRTRIYINSTTPSKQANGKNTLKVPTILTVSIRDKKIEPAHMVATSGLSVGDLRVSPNGKFLAGTNYDAGRLSVWKLSDDGIFSEFDGFDVGTGTLRPCSAVFAQWPFPFCSNYVFK